MRELTGLLAYLVLVCAVSCASNRPRPSAARATAEPAPASAGPTGGLEGVWAGRLNELGLRVVVTFRRTADGWAATAESPDQHAAMPIDSVRLDGDVLQLVLAKVDGHYQGRIAGDHIRGTWAQHGRTWPLELQRGAPAPRRPRPQEPTRPLPYGEIEVAVENQAAGVTLGCTLTEPPGAGPFGAVVLAAGSGRNDRDESLMGHKPFLVLSDAITRAGVAVLRCDKRGVAKSTGNFVRATTLDFAADVLAEVAALRSRPEIDRAHVGVAGHSEGATVAAVAAAKSADVAFIVLLAGPALPGDEINHAQRAWFARAAGAGDAEIAAMRAKWDQAYAIVKAEKDDAVATRKLRALFDALPAGERARLGNDAGFEALAHELLSPWMRTFIALDPRTYLAEVRVPALAVYGQRDMQVQPAANLPEMRAALAHDGDVTIRELPGLNHLFQTAKTGAPSEYAAIDETMAPGVLALVADWLARHAR